MSFQLHNGGQVQS